jgi:2-methylisocitrate lyase-like PEP mutase family enzyme
MQHIAAERISWSKALAAESPLLLPVAHDALTAKIIERAGFTALQIGGFAVQGSRHGVPDIDLTHFAERYAAVKDIMGATSLPIMVDADDGYGDVKNVTYTIRGFEGLGIQAVFLEDQQAPKECGHMDDKKVVPPEQMIGKIRAAVAAKSDDFFILARTDALGPEGLDSALRRGGQYLKAGADGIYVEGPETVEQLEKIGKTFKGKPLATSILENGGKTPWLSPKEFGKLGFTMLLYPTTLLFQATHAIQEAAERLRRGEPIAEDQAVNMKQFQEIVDLRHWQKIEKKMGGG